jgi:uncharacterized protein YqeY
MEISRRLTEDLKTAMRNGDKLTLETVRSLRGAIKNSEIDKGHTLSEEETLQVLQKAAKQRRESIKQYREAGRPELADQEQRELDIITAYLPKQMDPEEIKTIAAAVIAETGASSLVDMGKVMGKIMPRVRGKADGNQVNAIVKSLLAGE